MYFNQSHKFHHLKNKILPISFNLPQPQQFTFHHFNTRANLQCSKPLQQNLGPSFPYFLKHPPPLPFIIIRNHT
ncbi:single-stranded DNA-binding protein, partial [Staphylococcus epidermidis]|uniref:single-stranded DNA-binding protein n=1 Tax=Staphylococcus epidermidis TaxID=1282 RepID=UPI0021B313B2